MRRVSWAGVLVVTVGCASGGGGAERADRRETAAMRSNRCAPIVSDTLLSRVPVYPACGVDVKVRLVSGPFMPQYTPQRGLTCVRASLRVVVDANGRTVPKSERLIRTNDPALYAAMLAELPSLRYEPARKDGQPVAQIHEMNWIAGVAGPGTRRPNC